MTSLELKRGLAKTVGGSLAAVVLASACSNHTVGGPTALTARFELAAMEAPGAASSPVQPEGRPTGIATLTVNLTGFLASFRRVLAAMGALARVRVVVRFLGGTEFVEIVDRAALDEGQTQVTFTGLPEGAATLVIEALDASQRIIGSSTRTLRVAAQAPMHVDVAIPMGRAATSSGSASGGASTPEPQPSTAEGLVPRVTLIDGDTAAGLAPGTLLQAFPDMAQPWRLAAAPGDGMWAALGGANPQLVKLSTDGAILAEVAGDGTRGLAVDSRGHVWCAGSGGTLSHYEPNGTLEGTLSVADLRDVAVDAADQVWVAAGDEVWRITPHGQVAGRYPIGGYAGGLATNMTTGEVWVQRQEATIQDKHLLKLSSTGTILLEVPYQGGNIGSFPPVSDGAGNVWMAETPGNQVVQRGPDGNVLKRYPLPYAAGRLAIDVAGHLWVAAGGAVVKLSPDGSSRGEFRHGLPDGAGAMDLAVDAAGGVWVAGAYMVKLSP